MNRRTCFSTSLLALVALTIGTFGTAQAAAIKFVPNADLSTPFTFSLGDDAASYTFTSRDTPFNRPIGVSTTGTGEVASLGAPFNTPPQPTSYFPNQAFGADELGTYVSYNDRTGRISSSTGDVFIGLRYTLDDGFHFGYARVVGYDSEVNFLPRLISYGFQTTPNTPIVTGEGSEGGVAVPEPSSFAVFAGGFALIGMALFARRREFARADI